MQLNKSVTTVTNGLSESRNATPRALGGAVGGVRCESRSVRDEIGREG